MTIFQTSSRSSRIVAIHSRSANVDFAANQRRFDELQSTDEFERRFGREKILEQNDSILEQFAAKREETIEPSDCENGARSTSEREKSDVIGNLLFVFENSTKSRRSNRESRSVMSHLQFTVVFGSISFGEKRKEILDGRNQSFFGLSVERSRSFVETSRIFEQRFEQKQK